MLLEYLHAILIGTLVTLEVSMLALLLGLCLGLLAAVAQSSKHRFLRLSVNLFTSALRGLPELLILFFIYFGGTILLTKICGHYQDINALFSGVLGLSLIFSAYASQTIRGAFRAISHGQYEAALCLGMGKFSIYKKIMIPAMWRHALPGLGNLWLVLLKDSALVSLIGLSDLMNIVGLASAKTQKPFTFYLFAGLIYLILTSLSQLALIRLKRITNRGVTSWTL
jgi:His/Glu/Gln/Arg/opine family amino acid ABC transporter permease subunit